MGQLFSISSRKSHEVGAASSSFSKENTSMKVGSDDETEDGIQESPIAHNILKLFSELEHCDDDEQKVKIEKLNEIVDDMNEEEFRYVFMTGLFNKIDKMINEKKISLQNAIVLLKRMGHFRSLKFPWVYIFKGYSLSESFGKTIIEENKKKKGKNEKLLIDLCECYLLLNFSFPSKLTSIFVSNLLRIALNKEENEEIQEEVEVALLALTCMCQEEIKTRLYLKGIQEIIQYHQEHRNLLQLAYQSAWKFLINRLFGFRSLEDVIVNELHFVGEVNRELDELSCGVDWKRKKEEERGKEAKKLLILMKWLETLKSFVRNCRLIDEEFVELLNSVVRVLQAAKGNNGRISSMCIDLFETVTENRAMEIEDLLKSGAIDAVFEEIHRPTSNYNGLHYILKFFDSISLRLKKKTDDEMEEMKRKATKRKVFEKLEEEGYEDIIVSFHERFDYFKRKHYFELPSTISDYFI